MLTYTLYDSSYTKHLAFSLDSIHIAAFVGPIGNLIKTFRLPQKFRNW